MPSYLVTWKIDIDADSPAEAAVKAFLIQRDSDPANTATVFDVAIIETIDISEPY